MVEGCELHESKVKVLKVTPLWFERGEFGKARTSTTDNYMGGCSEGTAVMM